jgi:hypothetical protein
MPRTRRYEYVRLRPALFKVVLVDRILSAGYANPYSSIKMDVLMNEFLSEVPYSKARTVFIPVGRSLFQVTCIQQL